MVYHYHVQKCDLKSVEDLLNKHGDDGYEPYHTRTVSGVLVVFFRMAFETSSARDEWRSSQVKQ